ncbi:MAG: hypothetical protein ABI947_12215 [Chloroflexota bacterium]
MPDVTNEQFAIIEVAIADLANAFDVFEPPIPVEIMLQRPKEGMWKDYNLSELSTAFINIKQRYSPRMSVARLLARCACRSVWGTERKLTGLDEAHDSLYALARAILMPKFMLDKLAPASRTPMAVSMRFEVPEEDARQRLVDLGYLVGDSNSQQ